MILGFFSLTLVLLSFSYLFFSLFAVRRFAKSPVCGGAKSIPTSRTGAKPPVTVFKPVRGVRPESEELFRSFLNQNYPNYQVIFGVQDSKDPVLPLLEKLKREEEDVEISIVVNSERVGSNPKISNLYNMVVHAKHEIFVISDSDILVSPDYLTHMVEPFADPSVGVVTSIYKTRLAPSKKIKEKFVMALESLMLSVDYMPSVLVAKAVGKTGFAFGQSMAVRREMLDAIGGFQALADCNSDDYQLGARARAAGFRVFLSGHWVENFIFPDSFKDFFMRRLRWARVICVCETGGYLGSFITYLLPLALFHLLVWKGTAWGISYPWAILFLAVTAKISVAFLNNRILLKDSAVNSYWWLIPFAEIVGFGIWCASWLPRPVVWYGEKYLLKRDGSCSKVGERSKTA